MNSAGFAMIKVYFRRKPGTHTNTRKSARTSHPIANKRIDCIRRETKKSKSEKTKEIKNHDLVIKIKIESVIGVWCVTVNLLCSFWLLGESKTKRRTHKINNTLRNWSLFLMRTFKRVVVAVNKLPKKVKLCRQKWWYGELTLNKMAKTRRK